MFVHVELDLKPKLGCRWHLRAHCADPSGKFVAVAWYLEIYLSASLLEAGV